MTKSPFCRTEPRSTQPSHWHNQWEKNNSSGHLIFLTVFSMPETTPLPFHLHTIPVSPFEISGTLSTSECMKCIFQPHRKRETSIWFLLGGSWSRPCKKQWPPINDPMKPFAVPKTRVHNVLRDASAFKKNALLSMLVDRNRLPRGPLQATHLHIDTAETHTTDSHWAAIPIPAYLHPARLLTKTLT